jgi:penicillin G amidase
MKFLRRTFTTLLALISIVGVGGYLYLRQALPTEQGTFTGTKISQPATITRDADGVPHIDAKTLNDAWFAVGVTHAQDRLWQLEMNRRIVRGEMSELLGAATLENDKFLRALGVYRAAQSQLAGIDAETRAALESYAAGVNFGVSQLKALPPEFLILGAKPQPWTSADSMGWAIMMAWDLGGNWASEMMRAHFSARFSNEQINVLLPPAQNVTFPAAAPYGIAFGASPQKTRFAELLQIAPESGLEGKGSNNWVISGSRSVSGKPILANDPHLGLSAPALWYFASIKAAGFELNGATLPGLPMIVLGRNQHVAWGFTNVGSDVQDTYVERIHGDSYQSPSGMERLVTRNEIIKVKDLPDVNFTVRSTKNGPIINDATAGAAALVKDKPLAISLRWTALDADNFGVRAGLRLNTAKNAAEFKAATRDYAAAAQNMVYADTQGNIGWIAAGRYPIRHKDNDLHGLAPAPGWEAKYQWQGYVPFESIPQEENPPRGFISTANGNIQPPNYPYVLGYEWALPYRQLRIDEMLSATVKHSVESVSAMHADVTSLAYPHWLSALKAHAIAPKTEAGKAAWEKLRKFDGVMRADCVEPLLHHAWIAAAFQKVFADEVGEESGKRYFFERRDGFRPLLLALTQSPQWCNDVVSGIRNTCGAVLSAALDEAAADLVKRHGKIEKLRWGNFHQARSEHRPFGKHPQLAKLFDLRVPTAGDTYTLNVGRLHYKPDQPFTSVHAASLRGIYDLANRNAMMMQSTGQSGIRVSPHYSDLVERWVAVKYLNLGGNTPKGAPLTLSP